MKFIFLILVFSLNSSFAQTEGELEKVSESHQWRALLRYQRLVFLRSLNDNKKFFLSSSGKRSPYKELKANLKELKNNREYRCRFPARASFLVKEFELSNKYLRQNHCTKLKAFRRDHKTRTVSLVYTGYSKNKASSIYGDVFLRLTRSYDKEERSELADHAVTFTPKIETQNIIVKKFKSFTGGFKATFHTNNYYRKIRDIKDIESKDLWVYQLDINRRQIKFLIDHLWEMNQAYFDYHTIDENASYHILALLNAVNPEWKLVQNLPYFSTAPSAAIKVVKDTPGLVIDTEFVGSKLTDFQNLYDQLDSEQRSALAEYVDSNFNDKYVSKFSSFRQAQILDAAINYFDYKNAKSINKEDLKVTARKDVILQDRSQTPIASTDDKIDKVKTEAPDLIHSPSKITLGTMNQESVSFTSLSFETSFHDLLDDDRGLPKNLSYLTPGFRLSYADSTMLVDQIRLFKIENYQTFDKLNTRLSYMLDIGSQRLYDFDECVYCTASFVKGSLGVSKINKKYFGYVGVYQEFHFNPGLSEDLDYGAGLDLTAGLFFKNQFKVKLNYQYIRYVFNGFTMPIFSFEAQKSFKSDYSAKLALIRYPDSERMVFDLGFRY